MASIEKIMHSVLCGQQDKNIKFKDLQRILDVLGFECRIRGDHFIYSYKNYLENINIQPDGSMAKPYQVRQVRKIILKYQLKL